MLGVIINKFISPHSKKVRCSSDRGHSKHNFIVLLSAAAASLMVAVSLTGTVVAGGLHHLAGRHEVAALLGLDDVLLPPPPLLAVLQVLLPLVPSPELPRLDLAGRVVVRREAGPLLRDLRLSLAQQEGSGWSPGDVAAPVWSDLKIFQLYQFFQNYNYLFAIYIF